MGNSESTLISKLLYQNWVCPIWLQMMNDIKWLYNKQCMTYKTLPICNASFIIKNFWDTKKMHSMNLFVTENHDENGVYNLHIMSSKNIKGSKNSYCDGVLE